MTMQKKLFFIICFMIIVSSIFSACGKKGKKEKKENSIDNLYKTEQLQVNGIPEEIELIREVSDMIWVSGRKGGKACLGSFAVSKPDYQEVIMELPEKERIVAFYVDSKETIVIITSETQAEQERSLEKLRLYQYFKEGKMEIVSELKTCHSIYQISVTEENIYIVEGGSDICVFDREGKQTGASKSTKRIEAICGNEKQCFYLAEAFDSAEQEVRIGEIEPTGKMIEKEKIKMQMGVDARIFLSKDAEDELYYMDRTGIYKIRKENNSLETVLAWDSLGVIRNDIISLLLLSDGEFFFWNAKEQYFQQIKEKNKQEKREEDSVEKMVFASHNVQDMDRERIYRFNEEHKDCKIVIKDYSNKHEQFNLDVASGDIPDIINFSFEDPRMLAEKGIFTDLSVFMETDAEVSKEVFHDRLIELLEMDQGKLYFLPVAFDVSALVGSKKDIGGRESWTLKEFEAFCKEKKAEGKKIFPVFNGASFAVVNSRYTMRDYVDLNTGTVNFLTEDFRRMLSIAKDYFGTEIDKDTAQSLESIKDGAVALIYIENSLSFSECSKYQWAFGKEGYSFIGYPSRDNTQSGVGININEYYGIAESCSRKEEAWEFLRQYFLKDSETSINSSGFPVRKDVMAYKEECAMAEKTYINEKGEEITAYLEPPLTKKQIKQVEELIQKADMLNISGSIDTQISIIIGNEVYAGFNDNKSIEEIMDIIQSRISIMISEQK